MTDVANIAAGLTNLERELLLGESEGWGSWMFMVGSDLCAKGLGTERNDSIDFNTPLAVEVIQHLKSTRGAGLPNKQPANNHGD